MRAGVGVAAEHQRSPLSQLRSSLAHPWEVPTRATVISLPEV